MDYKQVMVERLKKDCKALIDMKIPRALDNIDDERGVNTYRNLTKALAENIKLIEEYENDYKPMWSIYKTGINQDSLTPQVAVWMQNSNGDISNHQVFNIDYKIKEETVDGVCNANIEKEDNKYESFKNQINYIVDNFMSDGKIIIPTSELNRGVGKTTYLIKSAIKNNGVYVSPNRKLANDASKKAKEIYGVNLEVIYPTYDIGRFKLKMDKMLYIDEGVDLDRIDLSENKYVALKYIPM